MSSSDLSALNIIIWFFYPTSWLFTAAFLTFELISNKSLIGQLPLWYKGTRLAFMQEIAKLLSKRMLRFYLSITLAFYIVVIAVTPTLDGIEMLAIMSLVGLTLVPIAIGYVLTTLSNNKESYTSNFRLTTVFSFMILLGMFLMAILISPWNFLWLFSLSLVFLRRNYNKWCQYDLEAIS